MVGRWFFLAVVAVGLMAIVRAPRPGAPGATVTQSCAAPGAVTAAFAWSAPPVGASEVWLDLSLLEAFPPALTNGHGPLAASQRSYAVAGLPEKVKLYYRINALASAGWQAVARGSFETACPGKRAPASRGGGVNAADVAAAATIAAKVGAAP